jgi:hypothetical protein
MELGNHSEFLGIMPSSEMLMRWFINDTMSMGTYRLKGHARADFWRWVMSWGVALRTPSDLGYSDDGFVLPPLNLHHIVVPVDRSEDAGEMLFRMPTINATTMHAEMRRTTEARAECAAALVNDSTDTWAVWCNTNYEADALNRLIPDAVEVRGSDAPEVKEDRLNAFSDGRARVIVTKASIAGFGLNWQHCHHTAFVGLSFSFEQLYQALRRLHRFGQQHAVQAHIITAETEGLILSTVQEKMAAHEEMLNEMRAAVNELRLSEHRALIDYHPRLPMEVPRWLRTA